MSFIEYLQSNGDEVLSALLVHVQLSSLSIIISILLAVPAGIILTRYDRTARLVLSAAGIIQTIPGLVMLGVGLMLFGLGGKPAVIVLVAYAMLPILQNTYTGIKEIDKLYIEAARGIGMSQTQTLFRVELPLSLPVIVAGVRLSVVYIISWATLAALIGAGGLGDLIWTGLSSYDTNLILAGALPASALSILAGVLIDLVHRAVTPRSLLVKGAASK